jgi:hypothetical protein
MPFIPTGFDRMKMVLWVARPSRSVCEDLVVDRPRYP